MADTPINWESIIYSKQEVDDKDTSLDDKITEGLDNKVNTQALGSPSGVATLNPSGVIPPEQIPFSTLSESDDVSNNSTVMTPERVHYQISQNSIDQGEVGKPYGVAPLDELGKVPEINLPPQRIYNTFVKETKAEMEDLPNHTTVLTGDKCVVTSDTTPANNGEYISTADTPSPEEWFYVPNYSPVTSVNGDIGAVVVSKTNTPDILTNETDIMSLTTVVDTNTQSLAKVIKQLKIDASEPFNDINLYVVEGIFKVDPSTVSNLPYTAICDVFVYSNANDSAILYQVIQNTITGEEVKRTSVNSGTDWSTFTNTATGNRFNDILTGTTAFSDILVEDTSPSIKLNLLPTGISGSYTLVDDDTSNIGGELTWNKISNTVSMSLHDTTANSIINELVLEEDGQVWAPLATSSEPTKDGHLVTKKFLEESKSYYFNKVAEASTTSDTYTQLNTLSVPAVNVPDDSTWELKFSMAYNLDTVVRSAYLRFSIDGGISWNEFRRESKNVTDNVTAYYAFPVSYSTSQAIDLIAEYRTEQNGDVLNVLFIDIMAERKI